MTHRNPWPDSEVHDFRTVARFMWQRRGVALVNPPRNSFPTAQPRVVLPRAAGDALAATWVGHSTVLLQVGGLNVLTDPVFSQRAFPVQWAGPRRIMDPGLAMDALPPLDAILLSHNHYDHLDKPAVRHIARVQPGVTWIVPLGVGDYIRPWGVRHIIELDWWQQAELNGLKVTATPARHFSGRTLRDRNRSLWSGFALVAGARRVLFVGDSAYHPEFGEIGRRCGPFELVMMPIGAYAPRWFMGRVHLDPEQAVRAFQDLATPGAVMLGIHWGTFRLTDEPMDEPPRLAREHWHAAGLPEDRLWIPRHGETRTII